MINNRSFIRYNLILLLFLVIFFSSVGIVVAAEIAGDKNEVEIYLNGFKKDSINFSGEVTKDQIDEILEKVDLKVDEKDRVTLEKEEDDSNEDTNENNKDILIVEQYRSEIIKSSEPIPYEIIEEKTSNLYKGEKEVIEEGEEGLLEKKVKLEYLGEELINIEKSDEFKREPNNQIVKIGTKEEIIEETALKRIDRGIASWYGSRFHGRSTSSGEPFDMYDLTAAHPELPYGTKVKVTCVNTGKNVTVRINDRGPHVGGRVIDLSKRAAEKIGLRSRGLGEVKVDLVK